jgi:protein-S-isoprenylcysteine O-methyltransferase Ste14
MTNAQSKHGGARVRFPPPAVFLALILAGVQLHVLWPLDIPLPVWLHVSGGSVAALGGALLVMRARILFSRSGQHPAPWYPSPELLVRGVYRYTRNPMYLGLTLFQLGLGVAVDNAWIASLAPLALLVVHVVAVLPEEAYLRQKFGESYQRYTAAVRRYV